MKRSLIALAAMAVTGLALAQVPASDIPAPLKIAQQAGMEVKKKFDAPSGLTGWVMQERGKQIVVYTTSDGKYVLAGNLMDANGKNLTKAFEKEHFTKPDLDKYWGQLESTKWIREGASDKEAKATVYVFTDPYCPYCHAAWEMVQPYLAKGLQVRWITVGILGDKSEAKAAQILGAANPLEAHVKHNESFKTAPRNATGKPTGEVAATLEKHKNLMRELGLSGTPGIVYKDRSGRVVTSPGLPQAGEFAEMVGLR